MTKRAAVKAYSQFQNVVVSTMLTRFVRAFPGNVNRVQPPFQRIAAPIWMTILGQKLWWPLTLLGWGLGCLRVSERAEFAEFAVGQSCLAQLEVHGGLLGRQAPHLRLGSDPDALGRQADPRVAGVGPRGGEHLRLGWLSLGLIWLDWALGCAISRQGWFHEIAQVLDDSPLGVPRKQESD